MTLSVTIRHAFSGFHLDAKFKAPPGVTALFGRSGSGKSTVVNAVAGLLKPDTGHIVVDGTTLTDTSKGIFIPPHRRRLGYVFQEGRLFPHLNVRQNLLYGRRFAPRGDGGADFDRIVDLLGLESLLGRRPVDLSGGEKQRVALGRAILSKPRLLLMDEPLAALDEARKADILPYLERLRDDTDIPIIYVSHSASEVARLATSIVLLEAGQVTLAGPAHEVFSNVETAAAIGLRDVGAILSTRLEAHEADGLTRLATTAGPLWLPRIDAPIGANIRIRLLAQDVMLAIDKPTNISALNMLPAVVRDIKQGQGPGVLVQLQAGDAVLLARITQRSANALAIRPGLNLYAVLKAVSVAKESIGNRA